MKSYLKIYPAMAVRQYIIGTNSIQLGTVLRAWKTSLLVEEVRAVREVPTVISTVPLILSLAIAGYFLLFF